MQQICHQIRAGGSDMSFGEISEVVPFLELAHDCGQDLDQPQLDANGIEHAVRLFKTHAWAKHCPPFQRTIVVLRNPYDVLLSFYHFLGDWFFPAGDVALEEFATHFWLARDRPTSIMENASYFVHLISWYERRSDADVMFVFFEDLKEDLAGEVRRIARFVLHMDRPDETLVQRVAETSSFAFMKAHESQFDEHFTKYHRNEACGLPAYDEETGNSQSGGSKIANGRVGSGKDVLPPDLIHKIDRKWLEIVSPITGCATYEDLRRKLHLDSCN